jgi:low molecular weight protein-tyrosine phosphatase
MPAVPNSLGVRPLNEIAHEASPSPVFMYGKLLSKPLRGRDIQSRSADCWPELAASSRGLAPEPSPENVGAISTFALQALNDRSISPAERFPVVCTISDLESADRVIALKEAEHRLFLEQRFPGWESRTLYWHVDDIDVAEPADTIAAIDQLVHELIKDCQNDNQRPDGP